MSGLRVVLGALLCLAGSGAAADQPALTGVIVDERGGAIMDATVHLNGAPLSPGDDGRYRGGFDPAEPIRLAVSAAGYYPSLHTFSADELAATDYRVPAIVLVRRQPGRVLLAFAGDTMMGRNFTRPKDGGSPLIRTGHEARDSAALLADIAPYMAFAELASVNLETPLIDGTPPRAAPKRYVFHSPGAMATALAGAGIDFVNLGNNHINDYLEPGVAATLRTLADSPLGYAGGGMTEDDALRPWRRTVHGVRIAQLGFVGWNGHATPNQVADGNTKSGAALGSPANLDRTLPGAATANDLVVVQYHGGREYADRPPDGVEARMRQAVALGADLVIGHHPHVLQGLELYRGKLIAYSLGNFVFDQRRRQTRLSALLYVWMDGARLHRAELVPLHIRGFRPTAALGATRRAVLRRLAAFSAERGVAFARSGGHAVIQPSGPALEPSRRPHRHTGSTIMRLPGPWSFYPHSLHSPYGAYRFGRDRLLVGDFEQPREWRLSRDDGAAIGEALSATRVRSGRYALTLPGGARAALKDRYGRHELLPGADLTLHGFAYSDTPSSLELRLATGHDDGESRHRLATVAIPGNGWHEFAVHFELADEYARGFTPLLENGGGEAPLVLDDLSLIQWQPWRRQGGAAPQYRADFVEFARTPMSSATVVFEGYAAPLGVERAARAEVGAGG